jgi:hypothetical protein
VKIEKTLLDKVAAALLDKADVDSNAAEFQRTANRVRRGGVADRKYDSTDAQCANADT